MVLYMYMRKYEGYFGKHFSEAQLFDGVVTARRVMQGLEGSDCPRAIGCD